MSLGVFFCAPLQFKGVLDIRGGVITVCAHVHVCMYGHSVGKENNVMFFLSLIETPWDNGSKPYLH